MRVAIVDDEQDFRAFVRTAMEAEGHSCFEFSDGRSLVRELGRTSFDLLFVDWNMPIMSGMEVIEWIKRSLTEHPGIIMMTARNHQDDIVAGLSAGADDYVIKPESAPVLVARADSVMRRYSSNRANDRYQTFGNYAFDRLSGQVKIQDETVALTAKEFQLALLFFQNLQRPLSREYIIENVWKNNVDTTTRTVDMHVSRLRAKLNLRPETGYRLHTVFGFGYRLDHYGAES
jgi:DNA-binding response OmpR family regulator